jgi:hypothetical protein
MGAIPQGASFFGKNSREFEIQAAPKAEVSEQLHL